MPIITNLDPTDEPFDSSDPLGLGSLPLVTSLARSRRNGRRVEIGDASVLPNARNAAASVPANPDDQTRVLPQAAAQQADMMAGYDKQIAGMQEQLKGLDAPPDYSDVAKAARGRGQSAVALMAASMAAGMGPQDMRPLQQTLSQMGAHNLAPQAIEGGTVDASGTVTLDPAYHRQKKIESLRDDIRQLQALQQKALTDAQAREARRLEQEAMHQLKVIMLTGQQQHARAMEDIGRENAETRRMIAEAKAAGANGPLSVKDAAQIEDRMGDDFRAETKDLRTGLDATRAISTLPTDRKLNNVEQQAIVVLLNKFLDPGSVVREGEFARTEQGMGLINRAQQFVPKILSGQFLTPQMVADIRTMADVFNNSATDRIGTIANSYSERAHRRGLDPRNVVGIYGEPRKAAGQNVPPGAKAPPHSYMD